jgi:hypothetical protein
LKRDPWARELEFADFTTPLDRVDTLLANKGVAAGWHGPAAHRPRGPVSVYPADNRNRVLVFVASTETGGGTAGPVDGASLRSSRR